MNILIIISQFSPAQDPNTIRWKALASVFKNRGDEVSILTTRRDPMPLESETDGIHIYRAGHSTMRDFLYNKVKRKSRRHEPGYMPADYGRLRGVFKKTADIFYRGIYWPDGSWLFLTPGIRKAFQIVRDREITHIISVGAPFTCHLIAARVAENHPDLHWHMDIEDPFSFAAETGINNARLYEHKNFRSESHCLELADSISLTNERALKKYRTLFPFITQKSDIIPPVFVKPRVPDKKLPECNSDRIKMAFFGSFYENLRSPENFMRFLKFLSEQKPGFFDQFDFHILGGQSRYARAIFRAFPHVSERIRFHGFLGRDCAMMALSRMDYLINIGNRTDYHLPSRVVEYLYFNKPIINFIDIEDDSFARFLNNRACLLNINVSGQITESHVNSFMAFAGNGHTGGQPDISRVNEFLPERIADMYSGMLTGVAVQ